MLVAPTRRPVRDAHRHIGEAVVRFENARLGCHQPRDVRAHELLAVDVGKDDRRLADGSQHRSPKQPDENERDDQDPAASAQLREPTLQLCLDAINPISAP